MGIDKPRRTREKNGQAENGKPCIMGRKSRELTGTDKPRQSREKRWRTNREVDREKQGRASRKGQTVKNGEVVRGKFCSDRRKSSFYSGGYSNTYEDPAGEKSQANGGEKFRTDGERKIPDIRRRKAGGNS